MELDYLGKKVLIVGDHPHTGEAGIVKQIHKLGNAGRGFLVELDSGSGCYVFHTDNLKVIK
jgi:hypothetical protein